MKRFILIPLFVILSFNLASGQVIKEMNVTIDMKGNDEVDMEVVFKFPAENKEARFLIPYDIQVLESEGGKCHVEEYMGSLLVCEPSSPFTVGQVITKASFNTKGMITTKQNKTSFILDIPIFHDTDMVNVEVNIPEMMVLANDDLLPLSPSGADIGSDGRRIMIDWEFTEQFSGDIIPLRIYYENLSPTNFLQLIDYRWIIFLLLVIVVGIFLIYDKLSKKSSVILSVLNEAERMIVNIIQGKGEKDIDQRILVSSSGFSKAKVSRILQSLEARGVVSIKRTGRKNRVTLKKKFVEEQTEQ